MCEGEVSNLRGIKTHYFTTSPGLCSDKWHTGEDRREKISWRQNIRDTYSRRRCRWVCTGSSRRGRGCRRGRTRPASTESPRSCSPRGTAASPGRQSRHVSGVWRCLEWSVPTKIIKTSRISKQKVILFPSQPPSPRPTVLYLVWGLWTV